MHVERREGACVVGQRDDVSNGVRSCGMHRHGNTPAVSPDPRDGIAADHKDRVPATGQTRAAGSDGGTSTRRSPHAQTMSHQDITETMSPLSSFPVSTVLHQRTLPSATCCTWLALRPSL